MLTAIALATILTAADAPAAKTETKPVPVTVSEPAKVTPEKQTKKASTKKSPAKKVEPAKTEAPKTEVKPATPAAK